MRIAWFTPWNRRSAIARYSRLIVEALAQQADVSLLLPSGTAGDEVETPAPIVRYDLETLPRLLEDYGVSVFNMGDSPFHFGVWDALRCAHENLHASIAILHDRFYLNLLYGHAVANGQPEAFRELLATHYDAVQADHAIRLIQESAPLDALEPFALCEPIVESADDFIVHSRFCRERAGLATATNVLELFIPAEYATLPLTEVHSPTAVPEGRLLLLTVGVGNRNKCLHLILEALAMDPKLAARITYVAAGTIEPGYLGELKAYARKHRSADVRFHGYVTDAELESLLARADLCVNLRRPCLEGGSASLLEALAAAKPLVVFDDGVYAEVPDDCVVKIPRDSGARQLAAALRMLVDDASRRASIGNAARRFVRDRWSLQRYVDQLLAHLAAREPQWAARPGLRAATGRAAVELKDIRLPPHGRAARTIADALGRWPA